LKIDLYAANAVPASDGQQLSAHEDTALEQKTKVSDLKDFAQNPKCISDSLPSHATAMHAVC